MEVISKERKDVFGGTMRHILYLFILQTTFHLVLSDGSGDVGLYPAQTITIPGKFISVNAACSRQVLLAVVTFEEPFRGAVYSRGYPLECRVTGNGSRELKLSIGVNECGTKVDKQEDGSMVFENYLYVQHDRQVQQSFDEQILVRCAPQDIVVKGVMGSTPSKDKVKEVMEEGNVHGDSRKLGGTVIKTSPTVESWMDVLKGSMPLVRPVVNTVYTGDLITMIVKIRHKTGVDTKVSNCFAHDGSKIIQQKLTDENGCSVDRAVLPDLQEKVSGPRGIKMVFSSFPAFKFPDRSHLHLQCKVVVCNYTCPVSSCRKPVKIRSGRSEQQPDGSTSGFESGVIRKSQIIEELNVFNSLEVRTAFVDVGEPLKRPKAHRSVFPTLDDTEPFLCLSSARLLLVVLGILSCLTVLLVIAICMCVRARKLRRRLSHRIGFPYGRVVEYT